MQGRIEPPTIPESIIVKVATGKVLWAALSCHVLNLGTDGGQSVFEIMSDDPRINPADCVTVISRDARDKLRLKARRAAIAVAPALPIG